MGGVVRWWVDERLLAGEPNVFVEGSEFGVGDVAVVVVSCPYVFQKHHV